MLVHTNTVHTRKLTEPKLAIITNSGPDIIPLLTRTPLHSQGSSHEGCTLRVTVHRVSMELWVETQCPVVRAKVKGTSLGCYY